MIDYTPKEVLLSLGPIKIFTWGFFVALAFLISYYFIIRRAKKEGYKEDTVYDILLYLAIGAIFGSRIFFVLSDLSFFFSNPLSIFAVWEGGMTSYGGIIGGTFAVYLACRKHKIRFLKFADLIAPYVALGLAIGRIGCFARFCCYGIKTAVPWGINIGEGFSRHPTQLYEIITNIFNMLLLKKLRNKSWFKKREGTTFFSFILVYSILRFFTDTFREYEPASGLLTSRIILILLFIGSSAFLIIKARKK